MPSREIDAYRKRVSTEMKRVYSITWEDGGSGDEPLVVAMEAGLSPKEFVAYQGEKCGVIPTKEFLKW